MNNTAPTASPAPSTNPPVPLLRRHLPGRVVFLAFFTTFLTLALIFVLVPFERRTVETSPARKAYAQAKQIGLALKLYAGDHDDSYPSGTDPKTGQPILTANDAFRCLFPEYLTSESLFGNRLSAYQFPPGPDNNITPGHILEPGENVYAYVSGLTEGNHPSAPLLADGTDGTGRGTYTTATGKRGGTWGGNQAMIIRLDLSCTLENLKGPTDARHIEQLLPNATTAAKGNPLSPAGLAAFQLKPDGPTLKLLDPAMAAPAKSRSTR